MSRLAQALQATGHKSRELDAVGQVDILYIVRVNSWRTSQVGIKVR